MTFIEILALTAALSLDSLAASVSFGLSKIKIKLTQALVISFICSAFLCLSTALSGLIKEFLSTDATKLGAFIILFVIGIFKFFEKSGDAPAKNMSALETLMFSVSMSLDSLAAGFGTGLTPDNSIFASGISAFIITLLSVYIGNRLGLRAIRKTPATVQKIGGLIIIAVAVYKLI